MILAIVKLYFREINRQFRRIIGWKIHGQKYVLSVEYRVNSYLNLFIVRHILGWILIRIDTAHESNVHPNRFSFHHGQ